MVGPRMNQASLLRRFAPSRFTWIVGLGSTLGFASQTAGFWIVGAFVNSGRMDIQQASLLSSAELVTIGLVTLGLAPVINRVPPKRAILLALALALLTQALSAVLPGFLPVLLARIGSGLAFGMIYAVATALGALAANPQKAYAAAGTISLAIGTVWNTGVGYATEHHGYAGVFFALSVYCLVVGMPMAFMSFAPEAPPGAQKPRTAEDAHSQPLPWPLISGVMLIMALFAVTTNGMYIFIEQVAEKVGVSGTHLGYGLTVSSLVSALGVAGLGRLGRLLRWLLPRKVSLISGHAIPLGISMLAIGATSWAFMVSPTATQMYISLTLWLIIYWAAYSYVLELAVLADPHGRVASAAGSILILLGGAGSAFAGAVAKHFGMQSFGLVAMVGCAVAAGVGVAVCRKVAPSRDS